MRAPLPPWLRRSVQAEGAHPSSATISPMREKSSPEAFRSIEHPGDDSNAPIHRRLFPNSALKLMRTKRLQLPMFFDDSFQYCKLCILLPDICVAEIDDGGADAASSNLIRADLERNCGGTVSTSLAMTGSKRFSIPLIASGVGISI